VCVGWQSSSPVTLAGTDDEPDSSDTLTADVDQSLSQQQQPSVDEDNDTETTEPVVDNDGQQQAKPELRYQYSEGLSVCLISVFSKSSPSVSPLSVLLRSDCLSNVGLQKV